jgi:hypothetical protein
MGINTWSRNDRARPSQKNSRFQAKLIKAMDCRVPNWPRTPGLKRRESENPDAAAWQDAHEIDRSADKAVS